MPIMPGFVIVHGGAGEVVGRHRAAADLRDERLRRPRQKPAKSSVSASFTHGHEQRVRAVAPLHVDREPEVHVMVAHDDRLAVLLAERRVERRGSRPSARSTANAMRWVKLTLPRAGARELVVEDLAVDLEQLGRHRPHRGRGGHAEARLHVLDGARRRAAQRLGLVAVEHDAGPVAARRRVARAPAERRGAGRRGGAGAAARLGAAAPARRPPLGGGGASPAK